MKPTKDKLVFGFLTIILCPASLYLILKISPNLGAAQVNPAGLIAALFLFPAIFILTGWIAFGWIGSALITLVSTGLALLLIGVYKLPVFYLNISAFLMSFLAGYKITKDTNDSTQLAKVEIEEIEEKENTISADLKKHASQHEALNKKAARYSELKDITELFSGSLSLDNTTGLIVKRASKLIPKADRTLIYLVDAKKQELMLKGSVKEELADKIKSKKGDIFDRWVMRQKQPLSILNIDKDFRFSTEEIDIMEIPFKSLIAYPLIAEKRLIGIMHMDSIKPDSFSPDDLRLLGIISDLGAVAIENAMLYQRTTELAIKDSLTDLFLHRYFKERLEAELKRAYLKNYNVSLLMIDIDRFKNYNDKYGHTAGDIMLKRMADIFTQLVDPGDIVARYGGEEFAVLLFGKDRGQAEKIADAIRGKIEKEKFLLRREETHATVSVGVSGFPVDAKTGEALIKTADNNLYKAKKSGRNRVC